MRRKHASCPYAKLCAMKKERVILLLGSAALLSSCGCTPQGQLSSEATSLSVASSAISSSVATSSEPDLPARKLQYSGDATASFELEQGLLSYKTGVELQQFRFDLDNNFPIETISDLLLYNYYQVAEFKGTLSARRLVVTLPSVGKISTNVNYDDPGFTFYNKEGNFYLDISDEDLSEIGIAQGKYVFEDAYAKLKDATDITALIDALQMPDIDIPKLLERGMSDPDLGPVMSGRKYDRDNDCLDIVISPASLAAVAEIFGSDTGRADIVASIDKVVSFGENSKLSLMYDLKTKELSGIGLNGTFTPKFEPFYVHGLTKLTGMTLRLDNVQAVWHSIEDFSLTEDFTQYKPFGWIDTESLPFFPIGSQE